jgi:hypothetical protein
MTANGSGRPGTSAFARKEMNDFCVIAQGKSGGLIKPSIDAAVLLEGVDDSINDQVHGVSVFRSCNPRSLPK